MLSQFSIATPQLLDELRINFAADALRFLVRNIFERTTVEAPIRSRSSCRFLER